MGIPYELTIGIIISIIIGLGWGSYATMATYRLPRGESWSGKKPRCPSCETELKFKDFAPVWAFVISRGRCKFCGVKVSPVYLLTELYMALVFVLCYLALDFTEDYILISGLGICTVILTITDLESRMIPKKVLLMMAILGVIYRAMHDGTIYGFFYGGLIGLVVGFAMRHIYLALKKESFDWRKGFVEIFNEEYTYVHLVILAGIWLPLNHFAAFFAIAGALSVLWFILWSAFPITRKVPQGGTISGALFFSVLYPALPAWVISLVMSS